MKTLKILAVFAIVALASALFAAGPLDLVERGIRDPLVYRVLRDITRATNNYVTAPIEIAASTTAIAYTCVATTTYIIDGLHKGPLTTAGSLAMAGRSIPKGYGCRFLFCVTATGALTLTQGRTFVTDPGAEANPVQPASRAVLGVVKVMATDMIYVPGSTNLAAASLTVTLYKDAIRPVTFTNLQEE